MDKWLQHSQIPELDRLKQELNALRDKLCNEIACLLDLLLQNKYIMEQTAREVAFQSSRMEHTDQHRSNISEETREELDRKRYMEPINHNAAFLFMLEHISEQKPMDWPFMIDLHAKLMNGIMRKNFGMPRTHNAYLRNLNGESLNISLAKPGEIYSLITKLVEFIKSQEKEDGGYDISTIAEAHAEFIRIHPFEDGNGRVGRLLLNAMLLKSKYAPAIVSLGTNYYPVMKAALKYKNISALEKYITERSIKGFEYLHNLMHKP